MYVIAQNKYKHVMVSSELDRISLNGTSLFRTRNDNQSVADGSHLVGSLWGEEPEGGHGA